VVDWLDQLGYYELTVDNHPDKENVRSKTNHYVTGRGGGHEIDLRTFASEGMQLYGSLKNIQGENLEFKENLKHNLDRADDVAESIKRTIDQYIAREKIPAPVESPYQPVWQPETQVLQLNYPENQITSVVWCIVYTSWVFLGYIPGVQEDFLV